MSLTDKEAAKKEERLNYLYSLGKISKPVFWAEQEFGWSPRVHEETGIEAWYQFLLLGCFDGSYTWPEDHDNPMLAGKPIQKFAWRIGRQCIPKGTIIFDRDGSIMPIEEHPDAFETKQNAKIYNIEMQNGFALRCTGNHPVSIKEHNEQSYEDVGKIWCKAENLSLEDEVETIAKFDKWGDGIVHYDYSRLIASGSNHKGSWSKEENISGNIVMNNELAELLGHLITDGNAYNAINKNRPLTYTNVNIEYLDRVEHLVKNNFPNVRINRYQKPVPEKYKHRKMGYDLQFFCEDGGVKRGQNSLKEFLRSMNFHPCGFPRAINSFTKEQVISFVRGAYMGDGSFSISKNNDFESTFSCGLNRIYAEYFQSLFAKFGVVFKLESQFMKLSTSNFYKLRIKNRVMMMKFRDMFGQIPGKEIPEGFLGKRALFGRHSLHNYAKLQIDGELTEFNNIKKISIENERQNCYDVEIKDKKWFACLCTIVHNSGKTEVLSIGALYLALKKPIKYKERRRYKDVSLIGTINEDGTINETGWTHTYDTYVKGAKIIVGSADADKARTTFDRVMLFISKSPKLMAAMDEGTIIKGLHPFPYLTFNIPGWTEPATITFRGPGAGGQTARSKTFDYKLYDEADYIPPIFYEAEAATSINAAKHGLTILSSTPTGKREYFYNACFVKNTPITMSDGSEKAIDKIAVGDSVINRFGKSEEVTKVMNRLYKGKLISFMTTFNDKVITATSNHRIMAIKKRSKYCKGCDSFVWKNRTLCVLHGIHLNIEKINPDYIKINDLEIGDYIAIPLCNANNPEEIFLSHSDGEFLYVPITQYLAEYKETIVYNLTVGMDHSYCVNGFGVANCTNSEWNFQEFHVPSKENPNYDLQQDIKFRNELTDIAYEHEIEANWGTVESGVFDWTFFEWVFRPFDLKENLKDPEKPIQIPVYKIWQEKFKKKPYPDEFEHLILTNEAVQKIGGANVGAWLVSRMPPRVPNRKYWLGADLGYVSDPTEMVVFEEFNGVMKMILRLSLSKIKYNDQCDIFALLDTFYEFASIGVDATGIGVGVEQTLKGKDMHGNNKYKKHNFEKRAFFINFSERVQVSSKFNGETVLVPVKQFMTDQIILHAQNKMIIMPCDDIALDIEAQFRNHTYTMGSSNTIVYSKSSIYPDHVIDAVRTAMFAKAMTKLPKNRTWPTGSAFKGRGSGAWA